MSKIELIAENRSDLGKGASRRLRLTGKTPAIVYGAGEPASVMLAHKDLWKAQESETFYSSILSLNIDGKIIDVIIKDLQRHPAKNIVLHADFQRVDDSTAIMVNVPLHFINQDQCPGVKLQGGNFQPLASIIKLRCTPSKLPAFIEVDMAAANSGDIVHISDIQLPEGSSSVDLALGEDHDLALAQINTPKGSSDNEDDASSDEAAAEPDAE